MLLIIILLLVLLNIQLAASLLLGFQHHEKFQKYMSVFVAMFYEGSKEEDELEQ